MVVLYLHALLLQGQLAEHVILQQTQNVLDVLLLLKDVLLLSKENVLFLPKENLLLLPKENVLLLQIKNVEEVRQNCTLQGR